MAAKKTCPFIYPPVKDKPTSNIQNLALYAKATQSFRAKAGKRKDFVKAVKDEAENAGQNSFECLTKEEISFVEGWMYATEHEYIDQNGDIDDAKLMAAIKRHIPDGGIVPMSG